MNSVFLKVILPTRHRFPQISWNRPAKQPCSTFSLQLFGLFLAQQWRRVVSPSILPDLYPPRYGDLCHEAFLNVDNGGRWDIIPVKRARSLLQHPVHYQDKLNVSELIVESAAPGPPRPNPSRAAKQSILWDWSVKHATFTTPEPTHCLHRTHKTYFIPRQIWRLRGLTAPVVGTKIRNDF